MPMFLMPFLDSQVVSTREKIPKRLCTLALSVNFSQPALLFFVNQNLTHSSPMHLSLVSMPCSAALVWVGSLFCCGCMLFFLGGKAFWGEHTLGRIFFWEAHLKRKHVFW